MAVFALLILHASLAWMSRAPNIETGQDDAYYLLLSRSLAHGHYRDDFLVGTPPHRMYPPGYPALLAGWQVLTGSSYDALALLSVLCSTIALALMFGAVRTTGAPWLALLSLAVLAVNPYWVDRAGRVMSEAPYAMFSLLALWCLARSEVSPAVAGVAGVSALMAALTRSVGATLVIAVLAEWALDRRLKRVAALAVASLVTVGTWMWWTAQAPTRYAGRSYLADAVFAGGRAPSWFGAELFHRVTHNVPTYVGRTLPYELPFPNLPFGTPYHFLIAVLTAVTLAAGLVALLRTWRVAALYLLAYGGLLALWPWEDWRFLAPIVALAVPAVLLGTDLIAGRIRPEWARAVVLGLGTILAINGAIRTSDMIRIRLRCQRGPGLPSPTCVHPDQASFFAALSYVKDHTAADALFLSAKPAPLYYYTGRRSVVFEGIVNPDPSTFLDRLRESKAEYVLLASLHSAEPARVAPLLEANCRAFMVTASFPPRTYLFHLAGGTAPNDSACAALVAYHNSHLGDDLALAPWPP